MSGRFGFRKIDMFTPNPEYNMDYPIWLPCYATQGPSNKLCFRCSGFGHLAKDCGTARPIGKSPSANRRDKARLEAFLERRQLPFACLDNNALVTEIQQKSKSVKKKDNENHHMCAQVVQRLASDMKTIKEAMSFLAHKSALSIHEERLMSPGPVTLAKPSMSKAIAVNSATQTAMVERNLQNKSDQAPKLSVPIGTQTDLVPVTQTSSQTNSPSEAHCDSNTSMDSNKHEEIHNHQGEKNKNSYSEKAIQANLPNELELTLQNKCAKLTKDRDMFQEFARKSNDQLTEARARINSLNLQNAAPFKQEAEMPPKVDFREAD